MSRKPQTPNDNEKPAGTNQEQMDIAVGRRFSNNEELLRIEKELLADGVTLSNQAIPHEYHHEQRSYEDGEIADIIKLETEKDYPNRNLIGYLNELQ